MKIFISHSGEASRNFANAFSDWIQNVIQAVEPFMSTEDIRKGARWFHEISKQLDETNFGVLCLTPDNLDAPWILFEAGALSKRIEQSHVCPLLLGVKAAQLEGPLAQLQATEISKGELRRLVSTINVALGDKKLPDARLGSSFDKFWPDLEKAIARAHEEVAATAKAGGNAPQRNLESMVEESLGLIRSMAASQGRLIFSEMFDPSALRGLRFKQMAPDHEFSSAKQVAMAAEAAGPMLKKNEPKV